MSQVRIITMLDPENHPDTLVISPKQQNKEKPQTPRSDEPPLSPFLQERRDDDAFGLLKPLNPTDLCSAVTTVNPSEELLSPTHQYEAEKMKHLKDINASDSVTKLDDKLYIIDDYIDSLNFNI